MIEQTTSPSLEAGSEALEPEVVLSEAEQTTRSEVSMARYPKSEVGSIQPLPRGWLGGMSTGGSIPWLVVVVSSVYGSGGSRLSKQDARSDTLATCSFVRAAVGTIRSYEVLFIYTESKPLT